jgi:hypothetical protein
LAALLAGKGIHDHVRRTHHALLNRCRSLQRQQLREQGLIKPTAELGQEFGQHEMLLGPLDLHLPNPTRIHDGEVGAQLATDLFIGALPLMLE